MKMDFSEIAAIVAIIGAVVSPVATTYLNNKHAEKMKQLEYEHQDKKEKQQHDREIYEGSTPSARRATQRRMTARQTMSYFYPRPPRGGRQQKQRENPLLLSHYTPLCTNCKEVPVKQTAKSHRYLRKRLVFRCEASGKTMCAARSHWPSIKRSAHYPAQTPGAAQRARP